MDSRRRTEGQRATGWRRLALIGAGAVGLMMMSLAAFPVVASADQTGKLRTGYFSSDAGNVDFYVDSQKAWSNVAYKTLSTYMGHSSITVTLDRYGHLMPGSEREAAGMLATYLERALRPGS